MRYRSGMATPFGEFRRADDSSYARFAKACRKAGERNLVWEVLDPLRLAVAAGNAPPGADLAVTLLQDRPFYSAHELAAMWPFIALGYGGKSQAVRPTAMALRAALVARRLPLLRKAGGSTFFNHHGYLREYFIVQNLRRWAGVAITQEQFDEIMGEK